MHLCAASACSSGLIADWLPPRLCSLALSGAGRRVEGAERRREGAVRGAGAGGQGGCRDQLRALLHLSRGRGAGALAPVLEGRQQAGTAAAAAPFLHRQKCTRPASLHLWSFLLMQERYAQEQAAYKEQQRAPGAADGDDAEEEEAAVDEDDE